MAASANGVADDSPSMSEAIERVGFGPAQLAAGFLGGGVYLVGGAVLLMCGALANPIGIDFNLRAWERAALMSSVFVGMLLGNSSSGPLGDTFGRRGVIVACYIAALASGIMCVFAQSVSVLFFWRAMLGASLGLGVPPWMVLSTEITPAAWRVAGNSYSQLFFVLGEIFSAVCIYNADPRMRHLDWRSLTAVSTLPGIVMVALAWMFLVESPAYLASKGEHEKARQVVVTLARQNGAPEVSGNLRKEVRAAENASSSDMQVQALFGRRMLFSTLTVIFSCFVLNLVFYGVLYGLPQVLEGGAESGTSPATGVLLGAVWEIPGLMAAVAFGTWFRRLPVICASYAGMACALVCFAFGLVTSHMWYSTFLVQGAIIAIKVLSNIAFVVIYQYASEIYPACARTTGSAICVSGGRVGAIIAPVVFETLNDYTGNFSAFFLLCALFTALTSVLATLLPFETAGKNLDDEMEPTLGKEKSKAALKLAMP